MTIKLIALATLTAALSLPSGVVQAQTANNAKKPAATKAAPAAKKAPVKKAAPKPRVPVKTAKAVEANTPVVPLSSRLTEAELAIADVIHTGKIQCELGADVTVKADEANRGFFYISTGKRRYYMYPVESRTGAIRLEDGRAGAMWLQLGNKSMLMDQRAGQRVADECATDAQRLVAEHMKVNKTPGLLDDPKK
ncbi:hypothetical protein [Ottowia thiooxydans]|uniref:hypothetical protein n=1 Tax=Ottowia thiooxydans TaxID=219182 RepID=UPI000428B04A|nr:hypothetical protein [Ottowia thiooxydans]